MKYKELEKIANSNDYYIEKNDFRTILIKEPVEDDYRNEIIISEIEIGMLDISMSVWFPWDFKIVKSAMDYAITPPEERQEEKRYYVRHRFLEPNYSNYLNFEHLTQDWSLSNKSQDEEMQTQFTQKEIDGIKKEYNVDLKDFEIVEVEE